MRYLALLLCLFGLSAQAQYSNTRVVVWTSPISGLAPTTATVGCIGGTQTTRGLQLDSLASYRITIQLPAGNAIGGGGYMLPYVYDTTTQIWAPDYNDALTVNGGASSETLQPQTVRVPEGCIIYVPQSITITGSATTMTITAKGFVGPSSR